MKHTLSCLVYNRPGVLARIALSFAEEGINILSLAAGETEDENKTRMTIVVETKSDMMKKAEERLQEIDEVIQIHDLQETELISRELLLIRIRIRAENIPQILQIAELFNAQVIAVSETSMAMSLSAEENRVNGMVRMLKPMGIQEMSRSGKLAVASPEME